jgi:hypothetical protein
VGIARAEIARQVLEESQIIRMLAARQAVAMELVSVADVDPAAGAVGGGFDFEGLNRRHRRPDRRLAKRKRRG